MSGIADLFRAVNWKGNAKLDALDEDHDGVHLGAALGTTIEMRLRGRLLFAFEIEGHVGIDSDSERTYGESTMRIRLIREGRFKHEAELTKAQ